MSIRTFILLLGALVAGCGPEPEPMDPAIAKQVEVVLRVRRLSESPRNNYWWYYVKILKVLKNDSAHVFTPELSVAAGGGNLGIPAGVSTIYLERRGNGWMLLGGQASTGVSHNTK